MNKLWFSAGIINLIASVMHLVMGYYDPLQPLLNSDISAKSIATLHAVWYMATLVMFGTSYLFLYFGVIPQHRASVEIVHLLAIMYLLFAMIFIFFSLAQWFLLLPISVLAFYGIKKSRK